MMNVDELAQDIRRVDGNHDLGAGRLAEKLAEKGWVKIPGLRVIEDLAELEALPEFSLIKFGERFGRVQMNTIAVLDSGAAISDKTQALPCLVLREGK